MVTTMTNRILIALVLTALVSGGAVYFYSGKTESAQPESPARTRTVATLPYRSGDLRFSVEITPEIPRVGRNTLALVLRDADGNAVNNASIRAVAEMPAMGTMPAMRAPADMEEIGSGHYEGTFEPFMEGSWPLTLEIDGPEMEARRITFDLATGRKGIQLTSGALRSGKGKDDQQMSEAAPAGTVTLDASRRQLIGVKTALAETRDMIRRVRAVGTVEYDQTRLNDISLKFDAWIGTLHADSLGKYFAEGEPLFTVYSPELYSAQQEFSELAKRGAASSPLLQAARKKLALWGIGQTEIDALARRGKPLDYMTIRAPQSGVVVSKSIVEGSAHRAGTALLRLADISRVWVEADVYESDLAFLKTGMPATITLPHRSSAKTGSDTLAATVSFIYPFVDPATRTVRMRLELDNEHGELKPAMYAEVHLQVALGERLSIPEEAVIIAGQNRFVFEDIGEGRLAPRKVVTGARADGYIEILDGLKDGDCVVTSGNFLIASESRLKAGIDQW